MHPSSPLGGREPCFEDRCEGGIARHPVAALEAGDRAAARERGDYDIAGVIAGEASALIHDIPEAGEIVRRIVAEAEHLLPSRLGGIG